MRYALLALTLAASTLLPSSARGQDSALSTMGTLTVGQIITSGSNATLLYSQQVTATGLVRGVTTQTLFDAAGWGPLDTGVLAGLNVGGLLTTSGITSVTGTISGTLTVSGLSSMTTLSATTLTLSGLSTLPTLVSTTGTITNLVGTTLTIGGNMTLTGQVQIRNYHENFGRVDMRNAQSTKLSIGTQGQQYVSFADTIPSAYISVFGGYGIGFSKDTGGVLVGILSQTDGVLRVTNGITSTGFGTIQTGGFASNFRAITTTGNLTVTDSVVTLTMASGTTTTGITVSLPSTSITGQQFIVKNIGSVTNTVSVVGGVKTIDGATTQAIISGAGKSSAMTFTYDGTNYIISQ